MERSTYQQELPNLSFHGPYNITKKQKPREKTRQKQTTISASKNFLILSHAFDYVTLDKLDVTFVIAKWETLTRGLLFFYQEQKHAEDAEARMWNR